MGLFSLFCEVRGVPPSADPRQQGGVSLQEEALQVQPPESPQSWMVRHSVVRRSPQGHCPSHPVLGMGEAERRMGGVKKPRCFGALPSFPQLSPEQNRSALPEPCSSSSLGRQQQ